MYNHVLKFSSRCKICLLISRVFWKASLSNQHTAVGYVVPLQEIPVVHGSSFSDPDPEPDPDSGGLQDPDPDSESGSRGLKKGQ